MDEKEYVSAADLATLKEAKTKMAFLSLRSEKAFLEAQLSEAEHKSSLLSIYVKYGLSVNDVIDEKTGTIVRKKPELEEDNGSNE